MDTDKPMQATSRRIAYFTNAYPAVSHSFIRREILALERQGLDVGRFALRGWDSTLVDEQDKTEQAKTRYVLERGLMPLAGALLGMLLTSPRRFFSGLLLACRQGVGSSRGLPYHLVYLAEACQLVSWLRRDRIEHVHAHFGTNSTEIVMLSRVLGGPPYSFTVHGPEEFDNPRGLHLAEKIHHAAGVVAITSFARSQLYRWARLEDWSKVHVVRCGLDHLFLGQAPSPVPDVARFVCVGRLCEQKGQLLLLDAIRAVLDSGLEAELVLAGDGEMRAEVERRIQHLDLQDNVRITGWISGAEVRDEILAARALVMASFAEGLPVVLMEAMALSRPVIVTSIAGVPELVEHGQAGWVVPAGDIDALKMAIADCLATPTTELSLMGALGRERVSLLHDVDKEAARLRDLFSSRDQQ
jgi:colanic acid/amylovoran biosynthesis glycosyltransferase